MEREVTDVLDPSLGRSPRLVQRDAGYRTFPEQVDAVDVYECELSGEKIFESENLVSSDPSRQSRQRITAASLSAPVAGATLALIFGIGFLMGKRFYRTVNKYEPDHMEIG